MPRSLWPSYGWLFFRTANEDMIGKHADIILMLTLLLEDFALTAVR
ncbi:MAG: hypothetical protein ACETVZ_08830 [Phycisphaerae bacterium]